MKKTIAENQQDNLEETDEIYTPHDRVFKGAIADIRVARDFFEHYLPKTVKDLVDLDTLEVYPNSHVGKSLNLLLLDMLFKVNFINQKDYDCLYLLVEHRSSVKKIMSFSILQYMVAVWNEHLKKTKKNKKNLPLIMPIIFYHGEQKFTGGRDIRELIKAPPELIEQILFKPCHLIDTRRISDESLQECEWDGAWVYLLKHIYDKDFLSAIGPFLEMSKTLCQKGAIELVELLLTYLIEVAKTEQPIKLKKTIVEGLSTTMGENMGTLAEHFKQEGIQEGIQKGVQIGREEGVQTGELAVLLRQLHLKFGVIPPYYKKRIEQGDAKQLLIWCDRILDAKKIEDLFEVEMEHILA